MSDIVTDIDECLKEFGRKQSSKLSPVPLRTVQIPEMVALKEVCSD